MRVLGLLDAYALTILETRRAAYKFLAVEGKGRVERKLDAAIGPCCSKIEDSSGLHCDGLSSTRASATLGSFTEELLIYRRVRTPPQESLQSKDFHDTLGISSISPMPTFF